MGHHFVLRRGCSSRTLKGGWASGPRAELGNCPLPAGYPVLSYPGALGLDGFDMQAVLHSVAGAAGLHTILGSPTTWLSAGLIVPSLLEQWSTEVHIIALFLGDVGVWPMHGLHVLTKRAGVCVPLGAAWDLADVGFLGRVTGLGYGQTLNECNTSSETIPWFLVALAGPGDGCFTMFTVGGSSAPGQVCRSLASQSACVLPLHAQELQCQRNSCCKRLVTQMIRKGMGKTHVLSQEPGQGYESYI